MPDGKNVSNMRRVNASSYAIAVGKEFYKGKGPCLTEQKAQQNGEDVMVTIVCITYGHEKFIAQALDSFLMQKTDFKFKVFVGEDHGSDGTAEIVRDYAARYPDIIVPFIREKNMGAQRNLIDLCQRAVSPYIAFCEGDDYWLDERKLQKQVDYLEKHLDFAACFHNTQIIAPKDWYLNDYYRPDAKGRRLIPSGIPGFRNSTTVWTAPQYIQRGPAHTSSMFFRWNYDVVFPEEFFKRDSGDHSTMMMQMGDGKVFFSTDVMSAYRRSDVGITMFGTKSEHFLRTRINWINVLNDLDAFFACYYGDYCREEISQRRTLETANYFKAAIENNNYEAITSFLASYPDVTVSALDEFIDDYHVVRLFSAVYGVGEMKVLEENRVIRRLLKPFVWVLAKIAKFFMLLKGEL